MELSSIPNNCSIKKKKPLYDKKHDFYVPTYLGMIDLTKINFCALKLIGNLGIFKVKCIYTLVILDFWVLQVLENILTKNPFPKVL